MGKTTTAINLSASLAVLEKKVLIIDADPQANSTSGLNFSPDNSSKRTLYEVMIGEIGIEDALIQTEMSGLHLIPSHINLVGAEIEMLEVPQRESVLKKALEPIRKNYDYIIIDCSPSLGLITVNALTAADSVIIPVQCEFYALEGIGQLLSTIREIKRVFNKRLYIEGVLLTMYDARTNLSQEVSRNVRSWFKDSVYKAYIPHTVKLAEAPSYGKSIFEHDPRSEGAKAYALLAREVIAKNS